MIYVFHGANSNASYEQLKAVESKLEIQEKLKLGKEHTYDDLVQALFSTSILDDTKLVIAQNFIKDNKVDFKSPLWEKDLTAKTVIFYESTQLTPSTVAKLPKHFLIEIFKEEPRIFWFLDSITPQKVQTLKSLYNLGPKEDELLIWNLANRFLLLTLAKSQIDIIQASNITGRTIAPWQWHKIKNQAQMFNLEPLKNIFKGLLKIDYLIKTGQSDLPSRTLVSYLLLKYLRS